MVELTLGMLTVTGMVAEGIFLCGSAAFISNFFSVTEMRLGSLLTFRDRSLRTRGTEGMSQCCVTGTVG